MPAGPGAGAWACRRPGRSGLERHRRQLLRRTLQSTQLTDANGNNPVTASWLSGASGVVAHPLDPVFPLQLYNATVPNQVLRGIGFRGGTFTDLSGLTPLTVAPSTETSVGHPAFFSDVFYPTQVWSANYFDTVDGLDGGLTSLAVAPAQYRSSAPGSTTGTFRQFTDLKFRLYYLGTVRAVQPDCHGGRARLGAEYRRSHDHERLRRHCDIPGARAEWLAAEWRPGPAGRLGDLRRSRQQRAHQWTSVDLTQSTGDPSLWTGICLGALQRHGVHGAGCECDRPGKPRYQ